MTIHQFKYYLHDDCDSREREELIFGQIPELDMLSEEEKEELMEKIGRPFYEVGFNCTINDETGAVNIISSI